MLIVAFKKGKAFPFYPFAMSELTDTVADADLVFGGRFHDLREQLLGAQTIERMFQLVEAFLLQAGRDTLVKNNFTRCMEYALRSIIHEPTSRRIDQLSHEIGYSQKHFINRFREQVGISPKQYLKIMRFQSVIRSIEKNTFIDWSTIALESGYYDQAHFIHDFKQFSGFTPNAYMQKKAVTLNYVPVD